MRTSSRAAVWATAALFLSLSCTSDRELVSNALASRHYEAGRCAVLCCEPGTGRFDDATQKPILCVPLLAGAPPECGQFKRDLNAFLDEVGISNDTIKIGKLPKNARRRLKATQAAAELEGKR